MTARMSADQLRPLDGSAMRAHKRATSGFRIHSPLAAEGELMTAPVLADQFCPAGRNAAWERKQAAPGRRIHASLAVEATQ